MSVVCPFHVRSVSVDFVSYPFMSIDVQWHPVDVLWSSCGHPEAAGETVMKRIYTGQLPDIYRMISGRLPYNKRAKRPKRTSTGCALRVRYISVIRAFYPLLIRFSGGCPVICTFVIRYYAGIFFYFIRREKCSIGFMFVTFPFSLSGNV